MVLFIATASAIRDVKTVYFLEPVTGLPKPVFYQLPVTERPIVSGIIVTGHLRLLSVYQSITCCFTAAVAHIPDARTPSQWGKGQWRIKAVGGRGNRCYAAVS